MQGTIQTPRKKRKSRYDVLREKGAVRLSQLCSILAEESMRFFNGSLVIKPYAERSLYTTYNLNKKVKNCAAASHRVNNEEDCVGHLCKVMNKSTGKIQNIQFFIFNRSEPISSRYLNCPTELKTDKEKITFFKNCLIAMILVKETKTENSIQITPISYQLVDFDFFLKHGQVNLEGTPTKKHSMILYFHKIFPTIPWNGGPSLLSENSLNFTKALANIIER